ncbi:MAG: chemotaxis protein CheA [Spirochaetes bacterium]|nr:chemotaxis protein CheA [Spirochaetota bacterium]
MIDKFRTAFKEEAEELLGQLENALLEIESSPEDPELINAAFRAVHTIKGSAGMFGFEAIAQFAHGFENLMDLIRNGKLSVDKEIVNLCLRARDHIKQMLGEDGKPGTELTIVSESLSAEIRAITELKTVEPSGKIHADKVLPPSAGNAAEKTGAGSDGVPGNRRETDDSSPAEEMTYRIRLTPSPEICRDGTKVLKLVQELSGLGDCTSAPNVSLIPRLSALDPEKAYCNWDFILTTSKSVESMREIFLFVEDKCELAVDRVYAADGNEAVKKLGEILVDRGLVSRDTVTDALQSGKKLGEVLVENKVVTEQQLGAALAEQEHFKKVQEKRAEPGMSAASIRVASEKLDFLVDLVGELVTLQARLSRTGAVLGDSELNSIAEQFDRLISQLRDNTMSIRMLPIGSTFNRFRRVVRDLSMDLGKDVELVTDGGETELDKTVIERLNDPLIHIIRNSLDHGIEDPKMRVSAGKQRKGTILLSAMHSGAHVLIKVSDDGAGIDVEAVRRKAVERGIVPSGQELSEQEIHQIIFQPGFSTAPTVTSVSGRGVGMDVVKREIDTLGGTVLVSSERGRGTTITLKIPLTLAIIEGLLVAVGSEHFVIPLASVEGCIEIDSSLVDGSGGRDIIQYRGELLPFIHLRRFLSVPGESPKIPQIVIVNALDSKVGFVVDQVIGDNQTVIKPLGRMYKDVDGISGATILGDGTVALIIDVNRLAMAVHQDSAGRSKAG